MKPGGEVKIGVYILLRGSYRARFDLVSFSCRIGSWIYDLQQLNLLKKMQQV